MCAFFFSFYASLFATQVCAQLSKLNHSIAVLKSFFILLFFFAKRFFFLSLQFLMIIFSARYCFLLLLLLLLLSETTLYDDEWLNRLHNIFQTFFFYASVFFFRADFIQLDRLHQFIGEPKVYIVICIYTNNCVKQIVSFFYSFVECCIGAKK